MNISIFSSPLREIRPSESGAAVVSVYGALRTFVSSYGNDMNRDIRDWGPVSVAIQSDITPERGSEGSKLQSGFAVLMAIAVNAMVLAKLNIPVVRAVGGFWYIFLLPAYLIYTMSFWRRTALEERIGYSVCATLLILMLSGLGMNFFLPFLGIQRPLGTNEVLVLANVINCALYVLRNRYPDKVRLRPSIAELGREEFRLLAIATMSVVLVVLGANRLNNGAGAQITLVALGLICLVFFLALRWLKLVRDAALAPVIYLSSLSLLLSTSLRGWYVTGHDIQGEYHVFQLTSVHARWNMAYFHDAYNACLSITILPTELERLLNIDDPYVFKLFFQLIFAICPLLIYRISRRYSNRFLSIIAVAFFIGFPTFFTDMPFLNRQAIALLFVSVAVLAITSPIWGFRRRQGTLLVAGLGVELSHYSSMYVLVGTLAIAWMCRVAAQLFGRALDSRGDVNADRSRSFEGATAVSLGSIIVLVITIALWGGLATGTSGQVVNAAQSAVVGLGGGTAGTHSGNVSFSLFGGNTEPSTVALQNYRKMTAASTAGKDANSYLPKAAVASAKTPYVTQQPRQLTTLGRVLATLSIPVISINIITRNVIANCYQLFLFIGLVRLLVLRLRDRRPAGGDLFWLSIGSIGMLGLITVLPSLSVDYGVLRAFQESLIFFSPVVVVGCATLFLPLGTWRAQIAAAVVCLGLVVNTTTLVPQLLGGNQAELNLNNSGTYYDLYYMRPQDEAAIGWLEVQPAVVTSPIQASYLQTRYLFSSPAMVNGAQEIADAFPTLVLRDSWVILGYPTVSSGNAYTYIPANSDLIEYKYPTELLDNYKSLVYTNGEAEIYK